MRSQMRAVAWALPLVVSLAAATSQAADLIWEVESPFRFFKPTRSFALHETAFNGVRGDPSAAPPADIIWRTERALNEPDCRDASTPDRCAATAGRRYQQSRLGWTAQSLSETCYGGNGRPARYLELCERSYSWGMATEDYVLPQAHTVTIQIAPEQLASATGDCIWTWQPRKVGGKVETKRIACKDKLIIPRVPYALDRTSSGVSVTVRLPDGRELAEPQVAVEDIFIVALGDSFASGESNPDRPVQFSAEREMVYEPGLLRAGLASRTPVKRGVPTYSVASSEYNPKVLPRRLMEDEAADRFYGLGSPQFIAAFEKASARWLSRDCHRSQYGYPFRVAMELALENRHRSVTFVSLTCSGAEVAEGLFLDMDPREGASEIPGGKVRAQFDQLSDLICRGSRSQRASYTLPTYVPGSTRVSMQTISKAWCPPQSRKRAIDVVLMSIGGNDVGFGALAVYSLTEHIADLAPIAGLAGRSSRFGNRTAAPAGDGGLSARFSRTPRMYCRRQKPRRMPRRSRDWRGHRLHAGDGPHSGIQQTWPLRPRSKAHARRRDRHAHAPQIEERRRVQPLLAGDSAALCPPLASVSHAKRRFPGGQYASARHVPVRHSATRVCGALQWRDSPNGRSARHRGRPRDAVCTQDRGQARPEAGVDRKPRALRRDLREPKPPLSRGRSLSRFLSVSQALVELLK